MARPKKHDEERRSARAEARLTPAEHEHVKTQAHLAGLDVSEYVRRRILGYEVPQQDDLRSKASVVKELNDLGNELSAIGNNANQLARSANSGRRAQSAWADVVARINELGDQVSGALERLVLGDS